jgi:hypothetical protein
VVRSCHGTAISDGADLALGDLGLEQLRQDRNRCVERGRTLIDQVTRVLGVILAALFVINGIKASFLV